MRMNAKSSRQYSEMYVSPEEYEHVPRLVMDSGSRHALFRYRLLQNNVEYEFLSLCVYLCM